MQVKLVSGLIIAGLLISQISLASPGFPDKTAHHSQNTAVDSPEQPYPSDSGSDDPIPEGDNDPVKVYAC